MSTNTPNYKLEKPEPQEFYDVGILNANMDKIDTTLKSLDENIIEHSNLNAIDAHGKMPACRVYNTSNISIVSDSETHIPFDSTRFDTDDMHDTHFLTRIICRTSGIYLITANVTWDNNSTGKYTLFLKVNGEDIIATVSQAALNYTDQCITTIYELQNNDYVEVFVSHTAGRAVNLVKVSNYSPEFSMVKVG